MRVGVTIPKLLPEDPHAAYGAVVDAVRHIEEAGFDVIWIPDVVNRGYLTFDPLIYAAAVASLGNVCGASCAHNGSAVGRAVHFGGWCGFFDHTPRHLAARRQLG